MAKKGSPSNAKVHASDEKKKKSGKQFKRIWTLEDEITILEGLADFTPKTTTKDEIKKFYESKKKSLKLNATYLQVKNKIRKLRDKYTSNVEKLKEGVKWHCIFSTPYDLKLFNLSIKVWGNSNDIEHAFVNNDDVMKRAVELIEKSENQELKLKLKELQVKEMELYVKRCKFISELSKSIFEAYINSISD